MRKILTNLILLTIGMLAMNSVVEAQNLKVKGSIGIGTATPAGPIHIVSSSAPPSSLPSGQNGLLLGAFGDTDAKWIQSYNGPLVLNPVGNNVGIGTTSAAFPLDVAGIVRITGSSPPTFTGNLAFGLQMGVSSTYRWIQSFESQPLAVNPGGNNVGIGTTNPFARLTVSRPVTNLLATSDASNNAGLTVAGTDSLVRLQLAAGGSNYGYAGLIQASYDNGSNGNGVENLLLQPLGGKVGIGTSTPLYLLHVNGAAAGTSWTNLSSREFKQNITPVPANEHGQMLHNMMKMALMRYEYKEDYGGDGQRKLGFVAEEMPKEVLSADGKGIDIYELLAYTIGALKAQQLEITDLKARLDAAEKDHSHP